MSEISLIACREPTTDDENQPLLHQSAHWTGIDFFDMICASKHSMYLFVAHDLSVVKHISDRVAVMYVGKLVETAETKELYGNPRHPYTEALLSAVPKPDPRALKKRVPLIGEVANPANPPSGCYFHPRCRYAQEICSQESPLFQDVGDDHWAISSVRLWSNIS